MTAKKTIAFILYILFCVFFAVGASAITLSMLAEEMDVYYRNKETLRATEAQNEEIRELITIYESQIQQIHQDPNVLGRFQYVTFHRQPEKEGVAFPMASKELLDAAQKALAENSELSIKEVAIPNWVQRCQEQRYRMSLFVAGAGLILTTFIFFGTRRSKHSPPPE